MSEKQLATILVIGVLHPDDGLAKVRQREQKLRLHLSPISIDDLVLTAPTIERVGEKLLSLAKLFIHEAIDEGDVVVNVTNLENLLPPLPELLVPLPLGIAIIAL